MTVMSLYLRFPQTPDRGLKKDRDGNRDRDRGNRDDRDGKTATPLQSKLCCRNEILQCS